MIMVIKSYILGLLYDALTEFCVNHNITYKTPASELIERKLAKSENDASLVKHIHDDKWFVLRIIFVHFDDMFTVWEFEGEDSTNECVLSGTDASSRWKSFKTMIRNTNKFNV